MDTLAIMTMSVGARTTGSLASISSMNSCRLSPIVTSGVSLSFQNIARRYATSLSAYRLFPPNPSGGSL